MRNAITIIISCLIFGLCACSNVADNNRLLSLADSLMYIRPDSSLYILKNISAKDLNTSETQAYYALLMTQANDKNYIKQTDDSLIKIAVQYYDIHNNPKRQAQAYYNWGSVYLDKNDQGAATEKYLRALSFIPKAGDIRLKSRIYIQLGYLYYLQTMDEKADSIFRLTEDVGMQLKDTGLWAEAVSLQGKIKIRQKLYQQAEDKLLQSLRILGDFKNDGVRASIASTLTSLYERTGDREKSIQYAKQNLILQRDTLHCYRAFLLLGDAYFRMEQYDSALIYFKKTLSTRSFGTKASAYMRLADIAKAQGNVALSLELERTYSVYRDSMYQATQHKEILEAEQQFLIQQQHTHYESFLNQYRYYIWALLVVSIISLYVIRQSYLKKLHNHKRDLLKKEDEHHVQYELFNKELKQKDEQIRVLQKEISQHSFDEEQKYVLQEEYEILKRQRMELAKKSLEHSGVYAKIERILLDYKNNDCSKESLNEMDWLKLASEIDKNGILSCLSSRYSFTEKETHLCYLLLLDLSLVDRARLMKVSRRTPYRREEEILKKMGEIYVPGKLQEVLKKSINM